MNDTLKARIYAAANSGLSFTPAGIARLFGDSESACGQAILELVKEGRLSPRADRANLYGNLEAIASSNKEFQRASQEWRPGGYHRFSSP